MDASCLRRPSRCVHDLIWWQDVCPYLVCFGNAAGRGSKLWANRGDGRDAWDEGLCHTPRVEGPDAGPEMVAGRRTPLPSGCWRSDYALWLIPQQIRNGTYETVIARSDAPSWRGRAQLRSATRSWEPLWCFVPRRSPALLPPMA